jgi:hypothetical protein
VCGCICASCVCFVRMGLGIKIARSMHIWDGSSDLGWYMRSTRSGLSGDFGIKREDTTLCRRHELRLTCATQFWNHLRHQLNWPRCKLNNPGACHHAHIVRGDCVSPSGRLGASVDKQFTYATELQPGAVRMTSIQEPGFGAATSIR